MRILYAASEAVPFCKTGGLADVAGSLPPALAAAGAEVAVVLPLGTNTDKPAIRAGNLEDEWLWARNKWLLAHPEAPEAAQGASIGLSGENIDIAPYL